MRFFLLLATLLVLTGCEFISDINAEIGFSEEEFAKSRPKPEPEEQAPAEGPGDVLAKRTAEWWGKAKSLGPREETSGADAMVRCKLGGAERFTRNRDCLAAGGTIL